MQDAAVAIERLAAALNQLEASVDDDTLANTANQAREVWVALYDTLPESADCPETSALLDAFLRVASEFHRRSSRIDCPALKRQLQEYADLIRAYQEGGRRELNESIDRQYASARRR